MARSKNCIPLRHFIFPLKALPQPQVQQWKEKTHIEKTITKSRFQPLIVLSRATSRSLSLARTRSLTRHPEARESFQTSTSREHSQLCVNTARCLHACASRENRSAWRWQALNFTTRYKLKRPILFLGARGGDEKAVELSYCPADTLSRGVCAVVAVLLVFGHAVRCLKLLYIFYRVRCRRRPCYIQVLL